MKATLEFRLPEEQQDLDDAQNGVYESPSEKAHEFIRGMRAISSCIESTDMLDICQEVIYGSVDYKQ